MLSAIFLFEFHGFRFYSFINFDLETEFCHAIKILRKIEKIKNKNIEIFEFSFIIFYFYIFNIEVWVYCYRRAGEVITMLYKGKSIFSFEISKSRNRLSYQDVSECYLQIYDQVNGLHMINANVYVDTCTLLSESGLDLLKAFQSLFLSTNHKLLITSAVLSELEKVGNRDPNKAEKVSAILDYIGYMEANNTLYIVYTPTSFNDSALVSRFVIELQNSNIILITNDIALANTASCLSEFLNQHCAINTNGHTVTAYKLCNSELIIIKKKERNDLYDQQLQKQQLFSVTPRFHFAG